MSRLVFITVPVGKGSARCRGGDIAAWLGNDLAVCNPQLTKIQADDVIICIKKFPFQAFPGKAYYGDIVDGHKQMMLQLQKLPQVKIITMTHLAAKAAKEKWFPDHEVIWLPHTHCNNENEVRPFDREIKHIIFNGTDLSFPEKPWLEFKEKVEAKGFITHRPGNTVFQERGDKARLICRDSYLNADIAVSFRKPGFGLWYGNDLKGPTKLNNASACGVPSIAFPETAFKNNFEGPGLYAPVETIDQMVEECCKLRDNRDYYISLAVAGIEAAKFCHIDNVCKKYLELLK